MLSMAQSPCSLYARDAKHSDHWQIMHEEEDDTFNASSFTSSQEDSAVSNGPSSSSSSEMADDASSSSNSYDLSELMAQLPIKRGLSKFYQGKSQSFTSLSRVTSIEDLPKKETPYRRKIKASKSYGGGLDSYKLYTLPKPSISKKASRVSKQKRQFFK